jgi:hypothetical protein
MTTEANIWPATKTEINKSGTKPRRKSESDPEINSTLLPTNQARPAEPMR